MNYTETYDKEITTGQVRLIYSMTIVWLVVLNYVLYAW